MTNRQNSRYLRLGESLTDKFKEDTSGWVSVISLSEELGIKISDVKQLLEDYYPGHFDLHYPNRVSLAADITIEELAGTVEIYRMKSNLSRERE